MRDGGNIRRHQRTECDKKGRAMWTDRAGRDKYAIVRIFDYSASGVQMELPEAVEARSVLNLASDDMKIQGQATVRFCKREGNKFVVGAEFVGGNAWAPHKHVWQ